MATKKKKAVKKIVKKVTKKPAKKPVKKSIKKAAKKTIKKAVKKSIKKPVQKQAKKQAKPAAKKPVQKAQATPKATPKVTVDYSKAITPLGDRLVVKAVSSERVTAGGLIIPDTASMAAGYLKAKVLAVGSGGKNKKGNLKPLDVKVGDTVLFSEYAGTKITYNSEDLQIIHESDVMGIVEN